MLAYAVGHFAWLTSSGEPTAFAQFFYDHVFSRETFNNVSEIYKEWDFVAVFTAGFTPVPFKIFTISAGMCDINFVMFVIASIVSRGLRFFLIAWLIWKYGAPIKSFIDKYLNLLATLLAVILIGVTVLIFAFLGDGKSSSDNTANDAATEEVVDVNNALGAEYNDVIQTDTLNL
jgi:membrane protein DedA with SNARE-associated domain